MSSISERLDRLPFSRFHRNLLFVGGLGYTFDAMDSASLAFILPVLKQIWALSTRQIGLIASSTYIGYLFGALVAGALGDLVGRKKVMMSALAVYTVASLSCVLADSLPPFVGLRVLAGLGVGAESAIIAPYLSEFVGKRYRGRFTGALAGFFSFGYFLAALLGYLILGEHRGPYQLLLIVTSLPILMLLWWRRTLPESPRWLECQGRAPEADRIVARIEAGLAGYGHSVEAPSAFKAVAAPRVPSTVRGNLATLWSGAQARVTAVCWFLWISMAFSYYAFFTWLPTLLVQSGMAMAHSYGFSVAIYGAQIPGYFSAAVLNERLGRRGVIGGYMLAGGAAAAALAFAHSELQILVAAMCLSFFMNGTIAGLYAYTSEIFPTRVRATGVGTSSAVGRVGAIGAPVFVGMVFPVLGFSGVFATTTVTLCAGALMILVFGVKTTGRSLEEIAPEAG